MADIEIRELREGDCEALDAGLRLADRDEITAMSGPDTLATIRRSTKRSTLLAVALVDGELACIFGLVPRCLLTGSGAPWMLGTNLLDQHSRSLMRRCRGYISAMQNECSHLENYVDARNARSIRWLQRLGFTVHAPQPMGVARLPFHRFDLGA